MLTLISRGAVLASLCLFVPGCGRLGFDLLSTPKTDPGAQPGDEDADASTTSDTSSAGAEGDADSDAGVVTDAGACSDPAKGSGCGNGVTGSGQGNGNGNGTRRGRWERWDGSGYQGSTQASALVLDCSKVTDALVCSELELTPFNSQLTQQGGRGEYETVRILGSGVTTDPGVGVFSAYGDQASAVARLGISFAQQNAGLLYLRFRLAVESGFDVDQIDVLSLADSTGKAGLTLSLVGNDLGARLPDGTLADTGVTLARDVWRCFDVEVDMSDAGNVHLWIDGQPTLYGQDLDTHPGTGIVQVALGILESAADQAPSHVWFDQIAVSDSPLPRCPG